MTTEPAPPSYTDFQEMCADIAEDATALGIPVESGPRPKQPSAQPMPLQEVIARLQNGPIDTVVERSALHHLEAGKRECQCGMTLKSITHHSHGIHIMGGVPRLAASPITFCPWCGGTVAHLSSLFQSTTPTNEQG